MRAALLLTSALALSAVAAPVPKALKKADDLSRLEGRWVGVSTDMGTGAFPDPDRWLEVKRGTLTTGVDTNLGYLNRPIRLDPSANPKHFDVITSDEPDACTRCVYELDGDTLRWCVPYSTPNRPDGFTTSGGFHVYVYKRVKE